MPLATRRIAVIAALGLTLLATACSGDDDDTDEPAEDATAEDATTSEPAADEEQIISDGEDTQAVGDGGDVAVAFAERLYENTPVGVTEDDAACLASAVIAAVGEATVESAGYDSDAIYGTTTTEQDAQIASQAFSCTSAEADSALAAEVGGEWPDAWNPA